MHRRQASFREFFVMNRSSVIVFQIDVNGVAIDPTERHAPVSAGVDRIPALVAANEAVKPNPAGSVLGTRSVVERAQILATVSRLNAQSAPVPGRKKPFEGLSRNERISSNVGNGLRLSSMPYTTGSVSRR